MTEIVPCGKDDGQRKFSPRKTPGALTVQTIDCPHRVAPGHDPEKWDAMKEAAQKNET